ncbi:MAG TPA: 23S rRNA (adenine(2503)-C(2))-methyltransferase RlmN [Mycobacteriales bacterium]|nr:23S rRNA (adenine(2503)-C(2))-methyltransferase RlmN [Mycobacteriales bacterium]
MFDAPRRGDKPPRHLADLAPDERRAAVLALGEPAYRARQLSAHYFGRLVDDPAAMTDLPAATREPLARELLPPLLSVVREVACDGGATRKTLWRAFDGALVESVLMRYPDRVTLCVSSQAGCGMACPFCATGQAGLTRNLSTAEIVEQVVDAARSLHRGEVPGGGPDPVPGTGESGRATSAGGSGPVTSTGGSGPVTSAGGSARVTSTGAPGRVTNVVFMGMGEPLANYARVLRAVRRLTDAVPDGLGLSQRSVVVSTVGLVPAIHRLAGDGLRVTLAVSLHAPDDELRDTLVPVNTRWPVADVLAAARAYADATGRRVSIEYALIRDVNDQPERADMLGRLLVDRLGAPLAHVNLIPLNPTPGSDWDASPLAVQREFVRRLRASGVSTTVRDTRGREIAGACGQLAARG